MKRYRMDKNEAEMTINDRVFCIAPLQGSNIDEVTKIIIENIARNKGHGGTEL